MVIPANISLEFLKGKKLWCDENLTTVLQFGNGIITRGDLLLELSHTGTVTTAVSFNGDDNNHNNIAVKNTSTGTVTNAFKVESGKQRNYIGGLAINSGGGSITNIFVDGSGNLLNSAYINGQIYSAKIFMATDGEIKFTEAGADLGEIYWEAGSASSNLSEVMHNVVTRERVTLASGSIPTSWTDVAVGANVPDGTRAVVLNVFLSNSLGIQTSTDAWVQFRKKGATNVYCEIEFYLTDLPNAARDMFLKSTIIVPIDSSKTFLYTARGRSGIGNPLFDRIHEVEEVWHGVQTTIE